jgi:hypothetical protein
MRYEISYDLNKPETAFDYKRLYKELNELGAKKILYSQWVVHRTGTSAANLRDYLWKFMDGNDRLMVVCLNSSDWAGMNLMNDPNTM